jgi:2-haloacid dehalogenase
MKAHEKTGPFYSRKKRGNYSMSIANVKALTFDVFGTVVDYRSTIATEGTQLNREKGIEVDWASFADAWRGRYRASMDRVMRGEMSWLNLDALHRLSLDELLAEFAITGFTEAEKDHLNRVWHRLQPWPDAIAGMNKLRPHFILATLSNGNIALLVDMAKYSGLPWDCLFSAELFHAYKPDSRVYLTAVELLGLRPSEVMMVASHHTDLHAARALGLQTAFVRRPLELGPTGKPDLDFDSRFDLNATDFHDLAEQLISARS